jgi:hypothetical protein
VQEDCEDTFCSCWLCINCRTILCEAIINIQLIQGWLNEYKKIESVKMVQGIFAHDTISESMSMTVISSCSFKFAKDRCSRY